MQIFSLMGRAAAIIAPALVAIALSGCGGSTLTEGFTSSGTSALPGATASLGVPPSEAEPPPTIKKSAKLLREVRALESTATPGSEGYRIGPQDVVEISIYQAPDLTKTVQVAEGGTINLPLVGDVRAGGITARELEHELKAKYGARYLQDPQVSVFVREYNSQRVTLEGAIGRPGILPYKGPTTLLQVVASAGGMKDVADGSEVMVFRTANGKKEAARFDMDAIMAGTAQDPPILQGDVIIVGTSTVKKLYSDIMKSLPVLGFFGGLI
jgi:polysaccharide export outer membrane protein